MLRDVLPLEPSETRHPSDAPRGPRLAVAFDGSDASWRGLQRAIELALDNAGSITLLGVVERPPWWVSPWPSATCAVTLQHVKADIRSELLRHLAAARDEVPACLELHTRVLHGRPADALAEACSDGRYEVLVCAPRALGRLRRMLHPGCTRALIARAPISVLAVPPPAADAG